MTLPSTATLSTVNAVNVPKLVIFGCAAVLSVPTNAVDVILVAPVTTPASTLIVPSNKIADPDAGSRLIAPPESNVIVVPTASKVPSAVSVMLAAAAAVSTVVISNVPFVPTVNVAVSPLEPVIVTTLPFIATSSTVTADNVVAPVTSSVPPTVASISTSKVSM